MLSSAKMTKLQQNTPPSVESAPDTIRNDLIDAVLRQFKPVNANLLALPA
jgi:hypothetical protein